MGDYFIKDLSYDVIGGVVCSILNETMNTKAFYDYKEHNGKNYFRFIIEGSCIDMEFNEMAELFETVDNLVVALYKQNLSREKGGLENEDGIKRLG